MPSVDEWDKRAEKAKQERPLRRLKVLPQMPGIAEENLKWKSLKYMAAHDEGRKITRHVLRSPLRHLWRYLSSVFKKKSYVRDDDFFFYGIGSEEEFVRLAKDAVLAVGFSYCQKPHECPSGRFNDSCVADEGNLVCQQCDIGKMMHLLPKGAIPLIIPTVHYIGDEMFKLKRRFPGKEVLFLITACEMTLEMFGDFGHMAGIKGIGVRLDGRICNTMKAFELSERGVKPGLTVVREATNERMLRLLRDVSCERDDSHPRA